MQILERTELISDLAALRGALPAEAGAAPGGKIPTRRTSSFGNRIWPWDEQAWLEEFARPEHDSLARDPPADLELGRGLHERCERRGQLRGEQIRLVLARERL